ncbi:uncharacterized protein LOC135999206 [Caloenas nicobarica]|uniref:uncharacterized protein LOC135999206 n=1 Tax=Caloenas nicobarica TaxID=187106 RepID=UPI0032B7D056
MEGPSRTPGPPQHGSPCTASPHGHGLSQRWHWGSVAPCTPVSALCPPLPAGRAAQDPADEATVQPPQQAAAGSAPPRGPPRQPGLPEDTGASDPSVVSTIVCAVLGPRGVRIVFHSVQRALDTSQRWLNRHLSERQADDARRRVVAITQQLWPRPPDIRPQLARLQRVLGLTNSAQEGGGPEVYRTMVTVRGQVAAAGWMLVQQLWDVSARLWDVSENLRARAERLRLPLNKAAQRARRSVAELRNIFVQVGSLEELLVVVVTRGEEVVTQAWQALGVFLLQHPALGWLQDAAGTARQDATNAAGTWRRDTAEAAGTVAPDTTKSAEMVALGSTKSAEMVTPDTTSSAETVTPDTTSSAETVTPDSTKSAEMVVPDTTSSAGTVAPDTTEAAEMVTQDSTEAAETVTPDSTEAAETPDAPAPDPQP